MSYPTTRGNVAPYVQPAFSSPSRMESGFNRKHWHGDISLMGAAAAAAKLLQSCLTLCDPISGSPPGAPVPGILQARTLEWLAISFSNAWKWKLKEVAQLYPTLSFPMLHPTRLLHPWDFPGKSTGVGCHCLLHPYGRQAAKNKRAAFGPALTRKWPFQGRVWLSDIWGHNWENGNMGLLQGTGFLVPQK